MLRFTSGTKKQQKSSRLAYPAFPCEPHWVTPVAAFSQLWFPPGCAHAAWAEPAPVASAYGPIPATEGAQLGLWPAVLFVNSSPFPPAAVRLISLELPAGTATPSSAARFTPEILRLPQSSSWFTELQKLYLQRGTLNLVRGAKTVGV